MWRCYTGRVPRKRIAKILVVEDDHSFAQLMTQVLQRQGHVVHTEHDGERALRRLREEHYDLLVLDLVLPRMMGGELLEQLSTEFANQSREMLPVILMSGIYQQRDQAQFMRSHFGVKTFLRKPFTLTNFMSTVERCLGDRGVDRPPAPDRDEPEAPPSPDEASLFETLSRSASSEYHESERETIVAPPTETGVTVTVPFRSPSDFLQEYADNIGLGGLFIRTSEPLAVGETIGLRLMIPVGEDGREISLSAEVVYVCREESGSPPGMGVEFLGVSDEIRQQLEAVAELAHEDARTGRPLLVIVHGSKSPLELLRERVPGADFRVRAVHELSELPDAARGTEPADLVLIELTPRSDLDAASTALRQLKAQPETARVITIVNGTAEARDPVLEAGADAFFSLPDEGEFFLRLAAYMLQTAQRRKHLRVRFHEEVRMKIEGVLLYARAENISEGGLGLSFRGQVSAGQEMEVEIPLPGVAISCSAVVCWAAPSSGGEGCRFGVRFMSLPARDREKVRAYVAEAVRVSNYIRWVSRRTE